VGESFQISLASQQAVPSADMKATHLLCAIQNMQCEWQKDQEAWRKERQAWVQEKQELKCRINYLVLEKGQLQKRVEALISNDNCDSETYRGSEESMVPLTGSDSHIRVVAGELSDEMLSTDQNIFAQDAGAQSATSNHKEGDSLQSKNSWLHYVH